MLNVTEGRGLRLRVDFTNNELVKVQMGIPMELAGYLFRFLESFKGLILYRFKAAFYMVSDLLFLLKTQLEVFMQNGENV